MSTILDRLLFEGVKYDELTSNSEKQEVELLALKLKPLEAEIVASKNGLITIMKSGNIFTDSFEVELANKISEIITGKTNQ